MWKEDGEAAAVRDQSWIVGVVGGRARVRRLAEKESRWCSGAATVNCCSLNCDYGTVIVSFVITCGIWCDGGVSERERQRRETSLVMVVLWRERGLTAVIEVDAGLGI